VHVDGSLDAHDDVGALVDSLNREAGSRPLVIDLTGLEPPNGPGVDALLGFLAHAPTRAATVLVHPDLETRRVLRAAAEGLPVVPSNEMVLHGRFAAAIVGHGHADHG